MGKVKGYIMDIEEDVYAIDEYEEKVSENISEVKSWVVEQLGLTTHFDKIDWCSKFNVE